MFHKLLFLMIFIVSKTLHAEELSLVHTWIGKTSHELSGMVLLDPNHFLMVSDEPDHDKIYEITLKKKRYSLDTGLKLKKQKGFKDLSKAEFDWDFEGIAACGSVYYLADERNRRIIMVAEGRVQELALEMSKIKEMKEGSPNAGIEGVAVDCIGEKIFVAKERDPRLIAKFDLKSGQLERLLTQLPKSRRSDRRVLDTVTGDGLVTPSLDISDLFFDADNLYYLERGTREIIKLNANDLSFVERRSYLLSEHGMYDTDHPYGLAEALAMDDSHIYIGIDQNDSRLSKAAEKKFDVKGVRGAILKFERPKGF